MGQPPTDSHDSELIEATRLALSHGGALARHDPGFVERESQLRMASAVACAIEQRRALVVEAGTGVGKTFAYLVPLLLSQRRALVSTATKALQDQLFLRDLPRLRDALGIPTRLALLKGRSSYLCQWRLERVRQDGTLPDRQSVTLLARVERWAQGTQAGDLAEVSQLDDRSPLIPLITSTRDNCLGSDCPRFRECHVVQARREAMAADLVVVNHHLFCADIALRDTGVAELLPTVDAVVFDEAHQLLDTGLQFLGTQLATGALADLGRDLLRDGQAKARGMAPWPELSAELEQALRDLRLYCAGPLRDLRGIVKLRWEERARGDGFGIALNGVDAALSKLAAALGTVAGSAVELDRLNGRCAEARATLGTFRTETPPGRVRWIDIGPREARLVESPLQVRELFEAQRAAAPKAWVFTSATLGTDDQLNWFSEGAALEDGVKLRVASPFDYAGHARIWVPRDLPVPNVADHPAAVGALAGRLAAALGGRTFVLTTTLRALRPIADALTLAARDAGVALELLVQGTEPRRTLLRRFLERDGTVLVGSASFWEGIDVVGDRLQCVVIDKLPFPPPNDPLVQARSAELRRQGRDAFNDYHLAEAAIALKQGAGRLIRSETDRGLLVVADVRMVRMGYGRRLLAALPPMTPIATEAEALDWLAELAKS